MNCDHTVVDLTSVPVPLATGSDSFAAALGRAGLVNATDRFRVAVLCSNNLLAPISQLLFIPLNRFEKAL
jgi:hypothetical protein